MTRPTGGQVLSCYFAALILTCLGMYLLIVRGNEHRDAQIAESYTIEAEPKGELVAYSPPSPAVACTHEQNVHNYKRETIIVEQGSYNLNFHRCGRERMQLAREGATIPKSLDWCTDSDEWQDTNDSLNQQLAKMKPYYKCGPWSQ